ncbi:MAG: hypothetical protein ACLUR5_10810 [Eubacterium ventriosum]
MRIDACWMIPQLASRQRSTQSVLGAMVLLRQKYPNMKIGVSVGGWTRSGDFPTSAFRTATRKNFRETMLGRICSLLWSMTLR